MLLLLFLPPRGAKLHCQLRWEAMAGFAPPWIRHWLESINWGVGIHPLVPWAYKVAYNFVMAWAIITTYTSKCAQMDPQQLLKTSKFYSIYKKCDVKQT